MKAKRNKNKLKTTPFIKQCCDCGNLFCVADGDIEFGPDPFREEIHGDDTPVWECKDCRINSSNNI